MNLTYCCGNDSSSPHSLCRAATLSGVACTPSIVRAGSPGTRWIMKNTRIVTPSATGTRCSSRRATYAGRSIGASGRQAVRRLLRQPGVLHVVVAGRIHVEPVQLVGVRIPVRRVEEERHERILGGLLLDVRIELLTLRLVELVLGLVRPLDDIGVRVVG